MNMLALTVLFGVAVVCVRSLDVCSGTVGVQWKTDPADCSKFYMCMNGRDFEFKCPENSVVNQETRSCVPKGSKFDDCTIKQKEPSICDLHHDLRVLHPDSCARYYDCSNKRINGGQPEVKECKFPFLVDEETKECMHYSMAKCGKRKVAKNECDYQVNQCRSAHCVPCHIRFPSCDGMEDGMNPWKGREGSPHFVVCENERVVYKGKCPRYIDTQHVFHPTKKLCVDFKELEEDM